VSEPIDLAVLAQDPWFGGGARAHLEAFCAAAKGLGRRPELLYLSREQVVSPLQLLRRTAPPAAGTTSSCDRRPYRSILPELDALNQLLGIRMRRAAGAARSLWVVASAAHYGAAALATGRPYACWIGTTLRIERAGRLAGGLPRSRRLALRVNAPLLEPVERAVLRRAAAVYAVSPATRRALAQASGLPEERIGVLPLPVDVDRFAPEPDERWLRRLAEPRIAFVGRAADPRKNLPLLLAAHRRLRERVPAARLRLIGPPPAGGLPEGVEAVGEVASVADELRRATLFVLPSWQEGFGIVAAEALACGVPAVVTPSGGPEELVRSSGAGVVLGSFAADELAATLADLLARPDRLLELRRRGREHVVREHAPSRLRERLAAALADLDADA
jgi:glycosyltransferase involved in cell wall biosynthesis